MPLIAPFNSLPNAALLLLVGIPSPYDGSFIIFPAYYRAVRKCAAPDEEISARPVRKVSCPYEIFPARICSLLLKRRLVKTQPHDADVDYFVLPSLHM
jgi:hypothetical protein